MIGKIFAGLRKTREALAERVAGVFSGDRRVDAEALEELEEALLTADVGLATIQKLMERLPREAHASGGGLRDALLSRMASLWPPAPAPEGPPPRP